MPLGTTAPGVAGPFFYEGRDVLIVVATVSNTGALATLETLPEADLGTEAANFLKLSGPLPAGTITLAPGASATVEWRYTRKPGAGLDGCFGARPFTVQVAARGHCWSRAVDDEPTPLLGFDFLGGNCPPGGQNLLFTCPGTLNTGDTFTLLLDAANPLTDRPFVLDAPGRALVDLTAKSGSPTWDLCSTCYSVSGGAASCATCLGPSGLPYTFGPAQTVTFTWTATALTPGTIHGDAGLDYNLLGPACHMACLNVPPPDFTNGGCDFLIKPPGIISVTAFTATWGTAPGPRCGTIRGSLSGGASACTSPSRPSNTCSTPIASTFRGFT